MAADLQTKTGATYIPPYNHADVICGQGTMALEFMDQVRKEWPGEGRLSPEFEALKPRRGHKG